MSNLNQELQRLFALPGQSVDESAPLILLDDKQQARTLILEYTRTGDWEQLAQLLDTLSDVLELPEPAVAITPDRGFQIWFSLEAPHSLASCQVFLQGLHLLLKEGLPQTHSNPLSLLPEPQDFSRPMIPAYHPDSDRWSAFIDPSMGAMFMNDAGLDMAPNPERQGDMLARLRSITAKEFQRSLEWFKRNTSGSDANQAPVVNTPVGQTWNRPEDFLRAVMNDETQTMQDRIRAASALLQAGRPGT